MSVIRRANAWRAASTVRAHPGVEHGFNNDTTPRYDARAAALAWQRTLAFFAQNLGTK